MKAFLIRLFRLREWRKSLFKLLDFFLYHYGQIGKARTLIRRNVAGNDPVSSSKRAAVFVHFDRRGQIHDYVIYQLKQLVEAGFRVVFVTNSPVFPVASEAIVAQFSQTILWRKNVGYDFGAYKDGIAALGDTHDLDGVLLMNDSVYGPFWKIDDVLSSIDPATTDFWGITDSWDDYFHIQSYFMYFLPAAFNSAPFRKFWTELPYVNHKGWVIRNGEIKLSQVLTRQKIRGRVLAPYWDVSKTVIDRLATIDTEKMSKNYKSFLDDLYGALIAGRSLNPMHFFWDVLILDYKCPFIKRELIKVNPAEIPFSWRWPEAIQATSDYDIALIQNHLQA